MKRSCVVRALHDGVYLRLLRLPADPRTFDDEGAEDLAVLILTPMVLLEALGLYSRSQWTAISARYSKKR